MSSPLFQHQSIHPRNRIPSEEPIIETPVIVALIALGGGLFGIIANHRLQLWRERRTTYLAAASKLRATFDPALAFLEKARRHGSDHERPDASVFLGESFAAHAEAINAFAPFIHSKRKLRDYQYAWNEYCQLAHDGGADAVFMASAINNRDPWVVLEGKIHDVLRFTKH